MIKRMRDGIQEGVMQSRVMRARCRRKDIEGIFILQEVGWLVFALLQVGCENAHGPF